MKPPIGFLDVAGRWWPVQWTPERIAAALDVGVDLAKAMRSERSCLHILASGSRDSLNRLGMCLFIACGGEVGIRTGDDVLTPEQFIAAIGKVENAQAAAVAMFKALAEFFPDTPAAKAIAANAPQFRKRRG